MEEDDNKLSSPPSVDRLRLDATGLNAYLDRYFPPPDPRIQGRVIEAAPGRVLLRTPFVDRQLRHGGVISGPIQMAACDTAAFALVIAHVGEVTMTVTTSLNIHFLRAALPGAMTTEAQFLKLSRRTAIVDVRLWTNSRDQAASQATVTFFIPNEGC